MAKRAAQSGLSDNKQARRRCSIPAQQASQDEPLMQFMYSLQHGNVRNVEMLGSLISETACRLLGAERATLFTVSVKQKLLVGRTADGHPIHVPFGKGIVGKVHASKIEKNVPNVVVDEDWDSKADETTGFVTRSLLCTPVLSPEREVLAVIQVLNKVPHDSFSGEDAKNLGLLLQLSVGHLLAFGRDSGTKVISNVPSSADHCGDSKLSATMAIKLTPDEKRKVLTPSFNILEYVLESKKDRLVPLAVHLFKHLGLCKTFGISEKMLFRFLLVVQSRYREIPYHSFTHACDVMQTAFCLLISGSPAEQARGMLKDVDILALLVSSLLHDIGHYGFNNKYHMNADIPQPLGILTRASGVDGGALEIHHCHLALDILESEPTAILAGLDAGDRHYVYSSIFGNILATDLGDQMTKHRKLVQDFKGLMEGYDKEQPEHRKLLAAILLKLADLSNPAKDFEIARRWGIAVNAEFHRQFEKEKKIGMLVTEAFNPETYDLPKSQKGFTGFIEPFFETVADRFPAMSNLLQRLRGNRSQWEHRLAAAVATPARAETNGSNAE